MRLLVSDSIVKVKYNATICYNQQHELDSNLAYKSFFFLNVFFPKDNEERSEKKK